MFGITINKDSLNPATATNINLSPTTICNYTEPNSLTTGFLNSVQELTNNPRAQTVATGVTPNLET